MAISTVDNYFLSMSENHKPVKINLLFKPKYAIITLEYEVILCIATSTLL